MPINFSPLRYAALALIYSYAQTALAVSAAADKSRDFYIGAGANWSEWTVRDFEGVEQTGGLSGFHALVGYQFDFATHFYIAPELAWLDSGTLIDHIEVDGKQLKLPVQAIATYSAQVTAGWRFYKENGLIVQVGRDFDYDGDDLSLWSLGYERFIGGGQSIRIQYVEREDVLQSAYVSFVLAW